MGFIRSSIPKSTLPWHRRLRSDRRSAWRWAVTVALAVLAAGTVRVAVADTEAARRHWGDTVPVLVTSSAVEAGASITSQTSIRRLPLGAVPEGATPPPVSSHAVLTPERPRLPRLDEGDEPPARYGETAPPTLPLWIKVAAGASLAAILQLWAC